jgi:hypothetical protein
MILKLNIFRIDDGSKQNPRKSFHYLKNGGPEKVRAALSALTFFGNILLLFGRGFCHFLENDLGVVRVDETIGIAAS